MLQDIQPAYQEFFCTVICGDTLIQDLMSLCESKLGQMQFKVLFKSSIFRYIYLPIITNLPSSLIYKLFGSAVCFSFVFVWHGTLEFILIWSLLNFLGITLEGMARAVSTTEGYKRIEDKFSPPMVRRLHAVLASPLLVMSSLSNFYFFAGTSVIFW